MGGSAYPRQDARLALARAHQRDGGHEVPFIGGGHIWLMAILLAIVLIIWGPGKLPDIGAGMGRAIREFKRTTREVHDEVREAVAEDTQASPRASPTVVPD